MAISDKDFQDLRDKVNSGFQTQENVILPALEDIKVTISKLAFVSQKDHDRDMRDIRKEIELAINVLKNEYDPTIEQAIKDSKLVNQGGVKASNSIFNGVGKFILAAIILAFIAAILYFGVLVTPALGGIK